MAEKIISPGVFTNEIDQSFLPATAGPIGAAIVGPTEKELILEPTIVSSYSEYVQIFGEIIESGSDKYQYLTSHAAQEYLRQGGPLTVVRVGEPSLSKAEASVFASGSSLIGGKGATDIFDIEVIGNGPSFNNTSSLDSNGRLSPRVDNPASNDSFWNW